MKSRNRLAFIQKKTAQRSMADGRFNKMDPVDKHDEDVISPTTKQEEGREIIREVAIFQEQIWRILFSDTRLVNLLATMSLSQRRSAMRARYGTKRRAVKS